MNCIENEGIFRIKQLKDMKETSIYLSNKTEMMPLYQSFIVKRVK